MISGLYALIAGLGMPVQTSINTQLGKRTGSPFTAALINFTVGIITISAAAVIMEGNLSIPVDRILSSPPWILTGGLLAMAFVVGNILLMPRVGSVQTAILPALGQIIMGTLIDTFGLFGSEGRELTVSRIIGVILVFAGVVIVISSKSMENSAVKKSNVWFWRIFGILMGCCMATQTAVNSHLGTVIDSRIFAAVINFAVGLAVLIIINAVVLISGKKNKGVKEGKAPWWILTGGLIGAWYCIGNIITAQMLGTGMSVIILLTGLMAGGLLVDKFGICGAARREVRLIGIFGIAVMIAGAALFHLV